MLFRELDTVNIRGRSKPIRMFQPLGTVADASLETQQMAREHRQAMRASKAGQWQEATEIFSRLKEDWGPKRMYELYLHGIEQASSIPPAADGRSAGSSLGGSSGGSSGGSAGKSALGITRSQVS